MFSITQCQVHNDCCSKNCLGFSYKCGANHGLDLLYQQYPQNQPQQPKNASAISNVEDLISRFGLVDDVAKTTEKPVDMPTEKPTEKPQEVKLCKNNNEQVKRLMSFFVDSF